MFCDGCPEAAMEPKAIEAAPGAVTERRISWLTLLIGFVCGLLVAILRDRLWGLGLCIGAALAWLNFHWLKRGLDALVLASTSQAGREKPRVPLRNYFGIIFRYGTRIQALAWGVIFLFQPLTAVYFPLQTLPSVLRSFAHALPPTYVFEMARDNLSDQTIQWDMVLVPMALNVLYVSAALWFFNFMYVSSRRTGQFAKLGT